MSLETQDLLKAFEQLSAKEKREFCLEILRRHVQFRFDVESSESSPADSRPLTYEVDSGPLTDEEIDHASCLLFASISADEQFDKK